MAIDVTNDMGLGTDRMHLKDWKALFTVAERDEYMALERQIGISSEWVRKNCHGSDEERIRGVVRSIEAAKSAQKRIIYKYDFQRFVDEVFSGDEDGLQDKTPTPQFHVEMYNAFSQASRVCIVCPRGHGKSSTSRIYILHQILHQKVKYVILLGSSEDMAGQNMRWIRDQLTDNKVILKVYGELYNKKKWAETEFVTSTNIKIVAKGAGQKIRGANEKGRPDLVYIDDLEDDEQVANKENRMKLANWFMRAVMPIRSKTGRFIVTGTILDSDSLLKNIALNRYRDHLRWKVLWYQALNTTPDGTEASLWPEMHPVAQLQAIREADPQMFAQEYQNNPTSGQMAVFRIEQFQFMAKRDIEIIDGETFCHGKKCNVMLHTDLAISEKTGADYTVLGVSAMSEDGCLYWPEIWRFRSNDVYDTIGDIFRLVEMYNIDVVTMETVTFQKAVKRQIEREMDARKRHFYIQEMPRHGTTKMARFKGLQSPIRTGKMFFLDEHQPFIEEEFLQLTATKLPRHDDVLDCVCDGWETQSEARGNKRKEEIQVNTLEWLRREGKRKLAYNLHQERRRRIR